MSNLQFLNKSCHLSQYSFSSLASPAFSMLFPSSKSQIQPGRLFSGVGEEQKKPKPKQQQKPPPLKRSPFHPLKLNAHQTATALYLPLPNCWRSAEPLSEHPHWPSSMVALFLLFPGSLLACPLETSCASGRTPLFSALPENSRKKK